MMLLKKIVFALYTLTIAVMIAATVVENLQGTPTANSAIYGSAWFSVLWALLVAAGVSYIIKQRLRRWNLVLLHLAFVVILAGALITHFTSYKGLVHLRGDQPVNQCMSMQSMQNAQYHKLPFYLTLEKFTLIEHPGTSAAADYVTLFKITDGDKQLEGRVSMNHIARYKGVRFYQTSYDDDNQGSYLTVNYDRWGTPVTYTGYALLFFSLVYLLIDRKGTFRRTLSAIASNGNTAAVLLVMAMLPLGVSAQQAVPKQTAEKFGRLLINYNNRICPVQTFALDFTQKLYGQRSYRGFSAEQVLMSWIFYANDWDNEPILKIKSNQLRQLLHSGRFACVSQMFHNGQYILGPYAADYQHGNHDALHKACAKLDGKLQIIMQLRRGNELYMFPYSFSNGSTRWFSPFDSYPRQLPKNNLLFIRNFFPLLNMELNTGNTAGAEALLSKLIEYQRQNAGNSLPSNASIKAELLYNSLPFVKILFIFNLAMGLLTLLIFISFQRSGGKINKKWAMPTAHLLTISFLVLTLLLALRWMASGNIPLTNGYETMLTLAWMVQAVALLFMLSKGCNRYTVVNNNGSAALMLGTASHQLMLHKFRHELNTLGLLMVMFGYLLSGFFLLVSNLSVMDPAIGSLMPVLNSPLLSVHVSLMMMSYALLAVTFMCGLLGLSVKSMARHLQRVSIVFLYPAMATLGIGIFLGAIWANVSWGSYWSWDPKETWALITFMLYAIALHTQSVPAMRRPKVYHVYMVLCFISIIITYFGVNYFMGGMHSYA